LLIWHSKYSAMDCFFSDFAHWVVSNHSLAKFFIEFSFTMGFIKVVIDITMDSLIPKNNF